MGLKCFSVLNLNMDILQEKMFQKAVEKIASGDSSAGEIKFSDKTEMNEFFDVAERMLLSSDTEALYKLYDDFGEYKRGAKTARKANDHGKAVYFFEKSKNYFSSALMHYEAGEYEEAKKKLLKASAARDEESGQICYWLGSVEEMLGNDSAAAEKYKKASDLDSDNYDYALEAGKSMASWGSFEEAVKYLTRAVESKGPQGGLEAHEWRGRSLFELRKYEEALGDLDAVIRKEKSPDVLSMAAKAKIRTFDFEGAKKCLRAIAEEWPGIAETYSDLGYIQIIGHDNRKTAMKLLKKAAKIDPKDKIIQSRLQLCKVKEDEPFDVNEVPAELCDSSEICSNYAQIFLQKCDYKKANEYAKRAVELDPKDDWTLYVYGLNVYEKAISSYPRSKEPPLIKNAIKWFERAVKLNPKNALAHYKLGLCKIDINNIIANCYDYSEWHNDKEEFSSEEIIEHFDEAISIWGDVPAFYEKRLDILMENGRHKEAERDATKLISIDDPDHYRWKRSDIRLMLKDWDGVIEDCKKLTDDKEFAELAYENMYTAEINKGRYLSAIKHYFLSKIPRF